MSERDDLVRRVQLAEAKRTVDQMEQYLYAMERDAEAARRGFWWDLFNGVPHYVPRPLKPLPGEYEKAVALLNDAALNPRK